MKQKRSILNTECVLKRLNGDLILFKALYPIYIKQIKIYFKDITKSMEHGDYKKIASYSHSLKSCFQTVGAELCEDLNKCLLNEATSGELHKIPQIVKRLENELTQLFEKCTQEGLV